MTGSGAGPGLRVALETARARARAQGSTVLDEWSASGQGVDAAALGAATGVQVFTSMNDIDHRVQPQVPVRWIGAGSCIVRLTDGRHLLLMADPWDDDEVARGSVIAGGEVEPAAATGQVLAFLRPQGEPAGAEAGVGRGLGGRGAGGEGATGVVEFVEAAIAAAYHDGASDLHLECDRTGVTAKLRLDGVITPLSRLDGQQSAEEVISRVKVLAQLDITERRLPQDGRFRYGRGGQAIDLRVSIMPSVFGEDAVLRLLDKSHLRSSSRQVSLDGLGFEPTDVERIRLLAGLPSGLLMVTGPTGSGKTTSVYAALSEINNGREKIITIEDPVEYELPGVLQIPVNERKGLSFAKGLRSILRHDPDRILVGEIRDGETAEIAVQSALTGHSVFTTVHANSLFDVIGRFRHFGIDLFGFVSALNGVVVQRLMRRLCAHCVGERAPTVAEAKWLLERGAGDVPSLPAPAGCINCRQTGYKGRFVIAEVHLIGDRFRDLVMRNADVTDLKRAAYADGQRPLVEIGIDKVRDATTSLEELHRVVGQI